jgi:hypothetical protein
MEKHNKSRDIAGVTCTVRSCQHHTISNHCQAGDIKVGTEYAEDKGETFCSTFKHRA